MKKQQQIEEIRKEIASLTEKLNKLEKAEVRPMDYLQFEEDVFSGIGADIATRTLSGKYAEKLSILDTLLCLRDEWNEIDGCDIVRYTHSDSACIINNDNLEVVFSHSFPFKFKDKPTAQLFLETFRPQLEQIKELL